MTQTLHVSLHGTLGAFALEASFIVPPGITALIGASGAGKSTLLRAVAGLERLSGEVRLDNAIWQDATHFLAPHRRQIGTAFQCAALLPHLSVAANLAYASRRSGAAPNECAAAVALLELAPLLARKPATLSGGERKRAALARALLVRPRLLLLDEPLAGVGAALQAALLPRLAGHFAALAIPVLYVSHDLGEVRQLTERVLILNGGRLIRPPSPSPDLRAAPTARSAGIPQAPGPPPDPY